MKKNIIICILILCSIEMWAQMSLPSVLVMKQNTSGLHSPAGGKAFYLDSLTAISCFEETLTPGSFPTGRIVRSCGTTVLQQVNLPDGVIVNDMKADEIEPYKMFFCGQKHYPDSCVGVIGSITYDWPTYSCRIMITEINEVNAVNRIEHHYHGSSRELYGIAECDSIVGNGIKKISKILYAKLDYHFGVINPPNVEITIFNLLPSEILKDIVMTNQYVAYVGYYGDSAAVCFRKCKKHDFINDSVQLAELYYYQTPYPDNIGKISAAFIDDRDNPIVGDSIAIATEANPAVDKFEMHIRMIDLQQMVMYNAQSFSTYTKIDPLGLTYVFGKRRLILLESDSPFEHINNTPLIYLDPYCRSNYNGYIVFHDSEQYISLCNFPISTTVCHNVLAGGISPTGPTWFLKGIVAGSEVQDPCHKVKKLSLSESDKYDLYKKIGLRGKFMTPIASQITTPLQDKSKQTICYEQ